MKKLFIAGQEMVGLNIETKEENIQEVIYPELPKSIDCDTIKLIINNTVTIEIDELLNGKTINIDDPEMKLKGFMKTLNGFGFSLHKTIVSTKENNFVMIFSRY